MDKPNIAFALVDVIEMAKQAVEVARVAQRPADEIAQCEASIGQVECILGEIEKRTEERSAMLEALRLMTTMGSRNYTAGRSLALSILARIDA
jgi:hypothetical protein